MTYRHEADRLLNLSGKLLLREGLKELGYDIGMMQNIQYNSYGRPSIRRMIDFNISHSGDYAICVFCLRGFVGVDIEKISGVNFKEYDDIMTESQWCTIKASSDSVRKFYEYWTIKESVIKADSRGMSIPLDSIFIENNSATCANKAWFLKEVLIDSDYCVCLATEEYYTDLSIQNIDYLFST